MAHHSVIDINVTMTAVNVNQKYKGYERHFGVISKYNYVVKIVLSNYYTVINSEFSFEAAYVCRYGIEVGYVLNHCY